MYMTAPIAITVSSTVSQIATVCDDEAGSRILETALMPASSAILQPAADHCWVLAHQVSWCAAA